MNTGGEIRSVNELKLADVKLASKLWPKWLSPMKRIGINDCFASNGPYEDLIDLYGLLGSQIAETVEAFLQSSACAFSP